MSEEAAEWDRCHGISIGNNSSNLKDVLPTDLFTDYDPATTIIGCGFRNKQTAILTIELATQPGCTYKSYWTIRAMKERAERHPYQNSDMRDAIGVFNSWFKKRKEQQQTQMQNVNKYVNKVFVAEKQQRAKLVKSFANKHARRYCTSFSQFLDY